MPNTRKIREVHRFTLSIRLRCRISSCSLAFWKRACSLSSAEVSKYTSTSLVGRGVGGTETKRQRVFSLGVRPNVETAPCFRKKTELRTAEQASLSCIPFKVQGAPICQGLALLDTLVHLPHMTFIHQASPGPLVTAAAARHLLS